LAGGIFLLISKDRVNGGGQGFSARKGLSRGGRATGRGEVDVEGKDSLRCIFQQGKGARGFWCWEAGSKKEQREAKKISIESANRVKDPRVRCSDLCGTVEIIPKRKSEGRTRGEVPVIIKPWSRKKD